MSALRITAGALRGRRIPVPKHDVRPTSERARQAYFNIVGPRVANARFLDLFAGSGIFSFEAVSRGAREAVAVDSSRVQIRAIEATALDLKTPVRAIATDVLAGMARLASDPFDLVYADPPYAWQHYDELLSAIDSGLSLADDAVVAIEHRRGTEPFTTIPSRLQLQRRAEYGDIWISFFTN